MSEWCRNDPRAWKGATGVTAASPALVYYSPRYATAVAGLFIAIWDFVRRQPRGEA